MREDADGEFERIRLSVRRRRGVDLAFYKHSYVQRRIQARMRSQRCPDQASYARLLASQPEEAGLLLAALSIKVTSFFRNPGLYSFLARRVLPEILRTQRGRTTRIWSAGCATGEETYSLAALVADHTPRVDPDRVRVIGTDTDREAILAARRAVYPVAALRHVPAELQRRFFRAQLPHGTCRPAEEVLSLVRFRMESLLEEPPAGAFDLILCRNVLIYFEPSLQHRIFERFARALRPGGWLALGRVERLPGVARGAFEIVNVKERVYIRT